MPFIIEKTRERPKGYSSAQHFDLFPENFDNASVNSDLYSVCSMRFHESSRSFHDKIGHVLFLRVFLKTCEVKNKLENAEKRTENLFCNLSTQ
jgi:hypothetical protein